MQTLIVFESLFGNTERVARAVAAGFADEGVTPTVAEVSQLDAGHAAGYDVLVLGGPTHAFSMSRPASREDAVKRGADPGHSGTGLREWVADLDPGTAPCAAVFDTRSDKVRHLPGSAARGAARALRGRGLAILDRPTSFYVTDLEGPLADGEVERAHEWGRRLAGLAGGSSHAAAR